MKINTTSTSSKIFKHGAAYIGVSIFTKFISFLLLPIITRYLTLEEYGVYTNLVAFQNIISGLATFGLDAAYGRYLYEYNTQKRLKLLTGTITTVFFYGISFF